MAENLSQTERCRVLVYEQRLRKFDIVVGVRDFSPTRINVGPHARYTVVCLFFGEILKKEENHYSTENFSDIHKTVDHT